MLNWQKGKNRIFTKIISLLVVQVFFFTSVVYPAPSRRSLFRNKRPNYKAIQERRENVLQKKKDIFSGVEKNKKSTYKKDLPDRVKLSSLKNLSNIYIPDSLGRVIEVYQAPSDSPQPVAHKPRLIIHIQDLHANPEAQFNEAKILQLLVKNYNLDLVCSEGAEGVVDTSSVSSFPDAEVREKTARLFVNSGELTAEEYLSITKYPDLPIWGIEDKKLYFQNIIEFNKIMEFSADAQVFIRQVKEALEKLKPKIYSKKLLEIDTKEMEYEQGKIDTKKYLGYLLDSVLTSSMSRPRSKNINLLIESIELEKNIDQQKIMQESQNLLMNLQAMLRDKGNRSEMQSLLAKAELFKEQKIAPFSFYSYLEELSRRYLKDNLDKYSYLFSFVDYLKKINSLDSTKLFQEIEGLTYKIKDALSTNKNQKLLTRALRHIKFLESFFNLKVSNEELDYYLANKESFTVDWFKSTITNLTSQTDFIDYNPAVIDENLPALEHFYKIARERDIAMVNNAIAEIEKRNANVAALISGGFHTRGITQLLKEKGYSYVVISPYSSTDIDEDNYRFLLSGKRKPLSEVIKGLNNLLRIPLGFVNKRFRDDFNKEIVDVLNRLGIHAYEIEAVSGRFIVAMVAWAIKKRKEKKLPMHKIGSMFNKSFRDHLEQNLLVTAGKDRKVYVAYKDHYLAVTETGEIVAADIAAFERTEEIARIIPGKVQEDYSPRKGRYKKAGPEMVGIKEFIDEQDYIRNRMLDDDTLPDFYNTGRIYTKAQLMRYLSEPGRPNYPRVARLNDGTLVVLIEGGGESYRNPGKPQRGKPRILLVDDKQMHRTIYYAYLKRDGYDVVAVGSSTDALKAIEREHFDVVVTDLNLIGRDGITLATDLKRKGFKGDIIVQTASEIRHLREEDIERAKDAEKKGLIVKIITKSPETLLSMLFELTHKALISKADEVYENLYGLSHNLWFEWNYEVKGLFKMMDRDLWREVDENPVIFLKRFGKERLLNLMRDEKFMQIYETVIHSFNSYMNPERETWVSKHYPELKDKFIVYSSLEFGVGKTLQNLQSGGLGALAGDHIKEMSDLGFNNFIGVGLAYKYGYFTQHINRYGDQEAVFEDTDFIRMPKTLVMDPQDKQKPLVLKIPMYAHTIYAKVWEVRVGRARLYLLDTDMPENDEWMKNITDRLYTGDERINFHQGYLLSVGQMVLLDRLGIKPDFYHLNESHAAFAIIGLIKQLMDKDGLSFEEALVVAYYKTLFTIHTPIAAGNWRFDIKELYYAFSNYFSAREVNLKRIIALGKREDEDGITRFNMAQLLLNLCRFKNGVSEEHGGVSREQWSGYVIGEVLNGVSIPYWQSPEIQELVSKTSFGDTELWKAHMESKKRLLKQVRESIRQQRERNQESPERIRKADSLFDENALTIVIARRFADYKRSDWVLSGDFERIKNILKKAMDTDRPVQIIFAGKAHLHDKIGQEIIRRIYGYIRQLEDAGIKDRVVFLENYGLDIARYLVQGADVWLSYPETKPIPKEASATSGEKAAVNGVVNAGIPTGFMRRFLKDRKNAILFSNINDFYNDLEGFIIPEYYNNTTIENFRGPSKKWLSLMRESLDTGMRHFGADRMIKDYTYRYYLSGVKSSVRIEKNNYELSRKIADLLNTPVTLLNKIELFLTRKSETPKIRTLNPDGTIRPVKIKARIKLGDIPPESVEVAIMFEQEGHPEQAVPMYFTKMVDKKVGLWECEGTLEPLIGEFKSDSRTFRIDGVKMYKYQVRVRPIINFEDIDNWPEKRSSEILLKIEPEVLHASWAHVEKFSPDNYHISVMSLSDENKTEVDSALILKLRRRATQAQRDEYIQIEGLKRSRFVVKQISTRKLLISTDIITQTDGEAMALLEKALEATGFEQKRDALPLIITSLSRSPRLFEDCQKNGFIGINKVFLESYSTYQQLYKTYRGTPLEKECLQALSYFKILLQAGLEHELRHENGVDKEDRLALQDARRIIELCIGERLPVEDFISFFKMLGIINIDFEKKILSQLVGHDLMPLRFSKQSILDRVIERFARFILAVRLVFRGKDEDDGSWKGIEPESGSIIFGNILPGEIFTRIKSRAENYKVYSELYQEVKQLARADAATTPSKKAAIAKAASFVYRVEKDENMAERAIDLLLNMPTRASPFLGFNNWIHDSEILMMYCQAYDMLKNTQFMEDNPEINKEIEKRLVSFTSDFYLKSEIALNSGIVKFFGLGQNNYKLKIAASIGMAGIVLHHLSSKNPLRRPSNWVGFAMDSIEYVLKRVQTTEAGAYAEGPGYLEYSLNSLLPFWVAYHRFTGGEERRFNGKTYKSPLMDEHYRKIIDWLIKIRCPDGSRPNYDDSHVTYSLSGMVTGVSPLYKSGVYNWDWLTSKKGGRYYTGGNLNLAPDLIVNFDANIVPVEPDWNPIQFMPREGVCVVRTGWGPGDFYLLVTAEHGRVRRSSALHEHSDEGSFILYNNGEKLIIDSGYGSFGESERLKMYAADKHSGTPLVDGKDSSGTGLFSKLRAIFKGRGADAFLQNFRKDKDKVYFEVKTGYRGVRFLRKFYVFPEGIHIVDNMSSRKRHTYRIYIQGSGELERREHGGVYRYRDTVLRVIMPGDVKIGQEQIPHAENWTIKINSFHNALTATTRSRNLETWLIFKSELKFLFDTGHEHPQIIRRKMKDLMDDIDILLLEITDREAPIFNSVSRGEITPSEAMELLQSKLKPGASFTFDATLTSWLESVYKSNILVVPEEGIKEGYDEITNYIFSLLFKAVWYFTEGDLESAVKLKAKHIILKKKDHDIRNIRLKKTIRELLYRYPDKKIGAILGAIHTPVFLDLSKGLKKEGVTVNRDFSNLPNFYNLTDIILREMQIGKRPISAYSDAEKRTFIARSILADILATGIDVKQPEEKLYKVIVRIVNRLDLQELRDFAKYAGFSSGIYELQRLVRNYINYLWVDGKITKDELDYLKEVGYSRNIGERSPSIVYSNDINNNTRILINRALDSEEFGGVIFKKLNIKKEDIANIRIENPHIEGTNRVLYKLIIQDKGGEVYEVALRTLGIDQRPFVVNEWYVVKSIISDNIDILDFDTAKKHIPAHYADIHYRVEDIPGIKMPWWYKDRIVSRDVGYVLFADEWIDGPTLQKIRHSLSKEEFTDMIQKVITIYCNGLNESLLWGAVDTGLDDIAVSKKYNDRLMFLDVGLLRESEVHRGRKPEIHEELLDLYDSYVESYQYCSSEEFFEAVRNSALKSRIPEILGLLVRDKKLIEDSIYDFLVDEFVEGLQTINRMDDIDTVRPSKNSYTGTTVPKEKELISDLTGGKEVVINADDGTKFQFAYKKETDTYWDGKRWSPVDWILLTVKSGGKIIGYAHAQQKGDEVVMDISKPWADINSDALLRDNPDRYRMAGLIRLQSTPYFTYAIEVNEDIRKEYKGIGITLMNLVGLIARQYGAKRLRLVDEFRTGDVVERDRIKNKEFFIHLGFSPESWSVDLTKRRPFTRGIGIFLRAEPELASNQTIEVHLREHSEEGYKTEILHNTIAIFNSLGYDFEREKDNVILNLGSGNNSIEHRNFINIDKNPLGWYGGRFYSADYLDDDFMIRIQKEGLESGENIRGALLYNTWSYITAVYYNQRFDGLNIGPNNTEREEMFFKFHFDKIWNNIIPEGGDFVFVDYMPLAVERRSIEESEKIVFRVEKYIKDKVSNNEIERIVYFRDRKTKHIIGLAVRKKVRDTSLSRVARRRKDITASGFSLVNAAVFDGDAILKDRNGFKEQYDVLKEIDGSIVVVIVARPATDVNALRHILEGFGLKIRKDFFILSLKGEALGQYESSLESHDEFELYGDFKVIWGHKIPKAKSALKDTITDV